MKMPKKTRSSDERQRVPVGPGGTVTVAQHRALLEALMAMLAPAVAARKQLTGRYDRIMRDVAAYLELEGAEEKLALKKNAGKVGAVPSLRFPLVDGHLQNVLTEVMNTLFPARNMYGSTVLEPDTKRVAQAMIAVMNHHAQVFGHYTQFGLAVTDGLLFNLMAVEYGWRIDAGVRMIRGEQRNDVLRSGNEVRRLDPYNLFLDWTVAFQNYAFEAQFYASVEKISSFNARSRLLSGRWRSVPELEKSLREVKFENGVATLVQNSAPFYQGFTSMLGIATGHGALNGLFEERPSIRPRHMIRGDCGPGQSRAFELSNYINSNEQDSEVTAQLPNEVLRITARIVPSDFGLSESRQVEVWKFEVLNGMWIVRAEQQITGHGVLPLGLCAPTLDMGELNSKSLAEKLVPFQDWISNMFNLHLKKLRKNVNNGLTLYDPKRVKLNEMDDPSSGFVPVSVPEDVDTADGRAVTTAVHRIPDQPTNGDGINELGIVEKMMQGIMPTAQLESVAGLQRAVDHQSRTVASAAGRRTFHIARQISDLALTPGMYAMTMNIISHQQAISLPGPQGEMIQINPEVFADADIKLAISDGLRGVDNVSIANRVENMIRYALQSRRVQTEVNVLEMIAYLLQLEGANFSIEQFRYDSPLDSLEPDQKEIAFQLYQQALAAQQQQQEQ